MFYQGVTRGKPFIRLLRLLNQKYQTDAATAQTFTQTTTVAGVDVAIKIVMLCYDFKKSYKNYRSCCLLLTTL